MSRRGQTNARTSSYSRRVPIPSLAIPRLLSRLPLASRSQRPGSIDRSSSSSGLLGQRGTRKCISGFLCSRGSRRAAPQLPEITSPRTDPRGPFSSCSSPFLPFVASAVPPRRSSSPFCLRTSLFPYPSPLSSYSSRLLLVSATRASPPAACRKPLYLSTYLSFSLLSHFLSFALAWIPSGT